MKPFALTAVLKHRKLLEDMAATKLAKSQIKKQQIVDQLHTVKLEYNGLVSDLNTYQSSGIGVEDLVIYEDRIFWLKQYLVEISEKLEAAVAQVNRDRMNVLKKSRDKKVLEQLKEKQDKAWQKYLDKKETVQLDEIAVLSHERRQQNK